MPNVEAPDAKPIRRDRVFRSGALLAAVAIAAGCSSGTNTTAPTPTPSSVQPARPDAKAAGAIYLRYVAPLNRALFDLERADRRNDLKGIRESAKHAASADYKFVRMLLSTRWPDGVQPLAEKLASEVARDIGYYRAASKAKSLSRARASLNQMPGGDSGTAQQIRAKLGLPEVPTG